METERVMATQRNKEPRGKNSKTGEGEGARRGNTRSRKVEESEE